MDFITSEIIIYFNAVLLFLFLVSFIFNLALWKKVKNFTVGKDGKSLENSFVEINQILNDYQKFKAEKESYLNTVETRLQKNIKGHASLNFNAFGGAESGGKSFAIAFVNEKGDGVIISSLNAREKVSIFTKEVKNWKSEIKLSDEEQEALTKSQKYCNL